MLNIARPGRTSRSRRARGRDEGGFALALMSLTLVALMGIAGLVVDLGSWQVEASRIQQAADAAALAGVVLLPDGDSAAIARARDVARANGFDDADADVDVAVNPLPNESLEVIITKQNVAQYFTRVLRGDNQPTITRRSTSQYVQPVPLGSPRNYLGTNTLLNSGYLANTNGVENFFLAISGECTRREYGDRIATRVENNPQSGAERCTEPIGGAIKNEERTDRGYLFGATIPPANGNTNVEIQMYDPAHCSGSRPTALSLEAGGASVPFTVTTRNYDNLDPYLGSAVSTRTFTGTNNNDALGRCGATTRVGANECSPANELLNQFKECWTTIATVSASGDYTIQVDPTFVNSDTSHNLFSLRAKRGGTFTACTSDTAVRDNNPATPPTPIYQATCPEIYALEHVPLAARGTGTPIFFLADISPQHNNKTMQVTLFDAAEGAETIELLDPLGNPSTFTWKILCNDGRPASTSGTCAQGDTPPTGGRDGGPTTVLNVGGGGTRAFPNNIQGDKYSDRLIRLSVKLPANIATAYNGATWWKIRYSPPVGQSFSGDRTTWSVKLIGDPVRLLPNN